MPTVDQILERIALLERQMAEVRSGLSISDDLIADFFNVDTIPGREEINPRIDLLENVVLYQGTATLMQPTILSGTLKTVAFPIETTDAQTMEIVPVREDVRCQIEYDPGMASPLVTSAELGFTWTPGNPCLQSTVIVPEADVRDFGVHLKPVIKTDEETTRTTFAYGDMGKLWFLRRPHVNWEVTNPGGDINVPCGNVLLCEAGTSSLLNPDEYSMENFGIALVESNAEKTLEVSAEITIMPGQQVKAGVAMQMKDILNGYLGLLETDAGESYVRLYKVQHGLVEKIAEVAWDQDFVASQAYVVRGKVDNLIVSVYIDDVLALQHTIEQSNVVSVSGEYGIACGTPTILQCAWVETKTVGTQWAAAEYGEAVTEEFIAEGTVSQWMDVEVDASVIQGRIELDYSIDSGSNFTAVPLARIDYPNPSSKKFSLASISVPASAPYKILFRVRLYETGIDGWVRKLKLSYRTNFVPVLELDGIEIINGVFKLAPPSGLTGTITMRDSFLPGQIYRWDKLLHDEYKGVQGLSLQNLNSLATVEVDSFQDGHGLENIFDADMTTYWESKRTRDGWICFTFQEEVEIHSFRWVKKSIIDGATFYRLQKFNEESGLFDDIHSFGFEVNADITHTLATPVCGTRFRIWIDCVQPISHGNAKYIELLGRSIVGESAISYEYSQDDGLTFTSVPETYSLQDLDVGQPVKLRAVLTRNSPDVDVFVRKFGFRFVGRDLRGLQLSNIKYDIKIGNQTLLDVPGNKLSDIRSMSGTSLQLTARFYRTPAPSGEVFLPQLNGYKIAINSSRYQAQIDELKAHVYGMFASIDRDPTKDRLLDVVLMLVSHEIDKIKKDISIELAKEVSKLRSRMIIGDTPHSGHLFPSTIFNVDALE